MIPSGFNLFYISYGPCVKAGPELCFDIYGIMLHFYSHSLWLLFLAFAYRYYVMHRNEPSRWSLQLTIFLVYIPSFIMMTALLLDHADPSIVRKMLKSRLPEYKLSGLVITGSVDSTQFAAMFAIIHMTVLSTPITIGIWILRRIIIQKLTYKGVDLTRKTKNLHAQLLKALTLQATIPVFYLLGVIFYFIGQFGMWSHPIIEFSIFTSFLIVPILTPVSSLIYVSPYKRFVLKKGQRIIPSGKRLFYISYGLCSWIGEQFCFDVFGALLHFHTHALWLIFVSFAYRYYVMLRNEPSRLALQLSILLIYIPSLVQLLAMFFQNLRIEEIRNLLNAAYPEYNLTGLTVTGAVKTLEFAPLYTLIHMTVVSTPITIGIQIFKRRIIKLLTTRGVDLSSKTRNLHAQLLRTLTFQSTVPLIYIFGVFCFVLSHFWSHPILEYFTYNLAGLTVTGAVDIITFAPLYTLIHMTVISIPLAIGIQILRRKIISVLVLKGVDLTTRSRNLHAQLLKTLTFQATVPLIYFLDVFLFFLTHICNHPILEFSIIIPSLFVPILTPLSSLYYVTPYRNFVRKLLIRTKYRLLVYNESKEPACGGLGEFDGFKAEKADVVFCFFLWLLE
ncbi:hypothetical protein L3Y34_003723 [Caenorhabditis briggsae]|uniref:Uncharacterized protein n=1 Tax=Caenorhabditis briggsae TaxID=6238 RepID=A0AAE9D3N3_CAEBR|nr:hypothetical protein L3Y34_003723 [Caenorhabditis briggsae]